MRPSCACIAVIGSPESVEALLDTTCRRDAMLEHLAGGEAWGRCDSAGGFEPTEGIITYRPEYEPLDVPDAWRPEYELDAPLYAPDGELIGMLSMDEPEGGRIPPAWVNDILELFAEQAVDRDPQRPAARAGAAGDGDAGAREGRAARRGRRAERPRDRPAPARPAATR